jgi:hypothetical protein
MGFYIRKSVRVGLMRFNLSKSGIGVSAGIRGLRVGTGPRGTYVHAGRGGLYYRAHLFPSGTTNHQGNRVRRPLDQAAATDGLTEIRSAPAEEIHDESSDSVLAEIQTRTRIWKITPIVLMGFVAATIAWSSLGWPAAFVLPIIAIPTLIWTCLHDETRRTTLLMYDLEDDVTDSYRSLHEAIGTMRACGRVWTVEASGANADYKYHAGASQLQRRKDVVFFSSQPPGIKTNVPVAAIRLSSETLYFFPERVFVYGPTGIGAVTYRQLEARTSTLSFIEEERVPHDARLVGYTWKYLNKNGSPDRRFAHNPQLPILSYGELFLASVSGLRVYMQTSAETAPRPFLEALTRLQRVYAASPERPVLPA